MSTGYIPGVRVKSVDIETAPWEMEAEAFTPRTIGAVLGLKYHAFGDLTTTS